MNDVDENSNEPPVFENQSFDYGENATLGELIGHIQASDPDFDPLTFTILSGNDNNAFSLNENDGSLLVNNADAFDFEIKPVFTLMVQVSDGTENVTADVTVNIGDVDEVTISLAGNMDFGQVLVGESATLPLTITNAGNLDLTDINLSLPEGLSSDFANGFLQGGQSTMANITFMPDEGVYSGTITVTSNAEEGDNSIEFSGEGIIPPPEAAIAITGDLDFDVTYIGETVYKSLLIENTGTADLDVTSFSLPDGLTVETSGAISIPPEGGTSVEFGFAPTEAKAYSGTLIVNSTATSGNDQVSFSGEGKASGPIISLSGDLYFGDIEIGSSTSQNLNITNEGNEDLIISSVSFSEGFASDYTGGTISANESESITVSFSPLSAQSYSGDLIFNSNAIAGEGQVLLQGVGINIALGINNENQMVLFPMPVIDDLTIRINENFEIGQIEIQDLMGRKIMELESLRQSNGAISLDLSMLKSGIYVMQIHELNGDNSSTFKLVKK